MDKQLNNEHSTSSNILLTATILLANLDVTDLLDYAVKAVIGGGIWLGYKLSEVAKVISQKMFEPEVG